VESGEMAAIHRPAAPSIEKRLAYVGPRPKIGARLGCRSVAQRGLCDRNG